MIIAVPKETTAEETRVALTPKHVSGLTALGIKVKIEKNAGKNALFDDEEYRAAGAEIASSLKTACRSADIILKIWAPRPPELSAFCPEQTIVCNAQNIKSFAELKKIAQTGVNLYALDLMPRLSRTQNMDILSSQNNLSGYAAVLSGAAQMPSALPMMITSAGTLAPAKVLIMGLGVAGLQAAATARRLGAKVFVSDIRAETREQADSVGAVFVTEPTPELLSSTQMIITAAPSVGKPASILLDGKQLKMLPPGCVIIDLAADSGGNVNAKQLPADITLIQNSHLVRRLPHAASLLYSGNMDAFCRFIIKDNAVMPDYDDEVIRRTLICRNGQINHPYLHGEH